jgi:hypothetical protein
MRAFKASMKWAARSPIPYQRCTSYKVHSNVAFEVDGYEKKAGRRRAVNKKSRQSHF